MLIKFCDRIHVTRDNDIVYQINKINEILHHEY